MNQRDSGHGYCGLWTWPRPRHLRTGNALALALIGVACIVLVWPLLLHRSRWDAANVSGTGICDTISVSAAIGTVTTARSADAAALISASGGACTTYDTWGPVLQTYLANWPPGSVTASDVLWTFSTANKHSATRSWIQVISGELWLRRNPVGNPPYLERTAAIVMAVVRMLNRGWSVPDFELLFQDSDGTDFDASAAHFSRAPVGSQSSRASSIDVPIPQCGFYYWREAVEHDGDRELLYNETIHAIFAANELHPYSSRKQKAVFRGHCNSAARVAAAAVSRSRPDILDVTCFSNNEVLAPYTDTTPPFENYTFTPLANFSKFAIVVNLPGNTYSGRTHYLFATGSPVLYVLGSPDWSGGRMERWYQFFYPLLVPFVHYWPVSTVEQLAPATEYLLAHPDVAERIAANAASFLREHLMPDKVDCVWLYYAHALGRVRAARSVPLAPGARHIPLNSTLRSVDAVVWSTWEPVPEPSPHTTGTPLSGPPQAEG